MCKRFYIKRYYKKSPKKDRDFIDKINSQIYPKADEKQYILSSISSAISGQSQKNRNALFLLGQSSAGKSLLMMSLNKAFTAIGL